MKNKYEVLGIVGEGAYGIVYKCLNKETNKYVAVKKFKETQDKLVQKTMKRELAMLQMLHHENVVEFQESFVSKGNFFLVFEYVEKNLLEVLEESPHGLSPKLIRSFYQMCKAVDYLHKNNMIHRDVKPENLLIDEKLNLKLCDFGFARKVKLNKNNNNVDTMTDYVATRWYRSPELLLSGGIYGPEVDYWAIGCIMGELADGNPMFPGEDEVDQLDCIIKILGNLPENLVNMYYENQIYNGKELLKVKKPETLEKRYLGILSPTAIDFMKGLLELDPSKRLSGENVFKHKYFSIFMKNNNNNNNNINNNENNEAVINNAVNPNNNLNNNNSNNAANVKVIKDDKSMNNKINNSININKIVIKNNPNSNLLLSNSNTKRNDANIMKESKSNVINKNMNMNINIKEKEEINSKKSEKDKQSDNAYSNRNNNNNSINNIVNNINQKINKNIVSIKSKKDLEPKAVINVSPAKVINNTTNINIINYNCYNNATNRNSNLQIQKKILDIEQNPKSQFKSFTNQEIIENNLANMSKSKEIVKHNSNNLTLFNGNESFYGNKNNFTLKKKINNNFTKSMINFNSIKVNKFIFGNKPSKKSISMKKIENEHNNNFDLSQKMPQTIGIISLSQGKIEKKKNSKDKEKAMIKQANNTFYNFNLNVIQNNNNVNNIINNSTIGNGYKNNNTSNNFASLLTKAYSTNGFKSFFANKDNKYNYKLNTNYIKEENKKYLYNNSFNDKIIDEKDELDISDNNIYEYNQKSYSKKKAKKKLLIPFGSENMDVYNKNNMGYGTFYKKNFIFGYKKKEKNTNKYLNNNKLPKLYKSISNATQYNYFANNKIKKNNSNIYMVGKKAFNPYNYDYTSKFKFYLP